LGAKKSIFFWHQIGKIVYPFIRPVYYVCRKKSGNQAASCEISTEGIEMKKQIQIGVGVNNYLPVPIPIPSIIASLPAKRSPCFSTSLIAS
jgi:hypothetical protein